MPRILTPPSPTPIIQPQQAGAVAWGDQIASAAWVEEKQSRTSRHTLLKKTLVYRFVVRGRPDQAEQDANLGAAKMGFPHPEKRGYFITDITYVHHAYGVDPDDTTSERPTTARDSEPLTLVTITYETIPPPGLWTEEYDTVLITRLEWYDRAGKSLMNTREGIPLLIAQVLYRRVYPKTFLTQANVDAIQDIEGKRNGSVWLRRGPGEWLMEKARCRLIHGNPRDDDDCAYEVTLQARRDPERKHNWWFPMTDASGVPISHYDPAHPEEAFTIRTLYTLDEQDWDAVVPLRGTPITAGGWEDNP